MNNFDTIKSILAWGKATLFNSETASLDAQLLLMETLGVERAYLIAHDDESLSPAQAQQYRSWVERRAEGEPVAYLVGKRSFYNLEFFVTPAVLIPRPETEHLIEAGLEFLRGKNNAIAVDVGTGSGAIAVTIKHNAPSVEMHAVDISPNALEVAQRNARQQHAEIHFHHGNLLEPLIKNGLRVDAVFANLPYIETDELSELEVTKHEPALALDGGHDGLDLVRELIQQLPTVLKTGGLVLLEIGASQGQATADLLRPLAQEVDIIRDYAGHDRIVRAIVK